MRITQQSQEACICGAYGISVKFLPKFKLGRVRKNPNGTTVAFLNVVFLYEPRTHPSPTFGREQTLKGEIWNIVSSSLPTSCSCEQMHLHYILSHLKTLKAMSDTLAGTVSTCATRIRKYRLHWGGVIITTSSTSTSRNRHPSSSKVLLRPICIL